MPKFAFSTAHGFSGAEQWTGMSKYQISEFDQILVCEESD